MADDKARLRDHFKQVRMNLTESERNIREKRLEAIAWTWLSTQFHLTSFMTANEIKTFGFYAATKGEVDLRTLADRLRLVGCRIAFPRILPRQHMAFCLVDAQDELVPGPYGIRAPADHHPVVEREALDAIFVPGLAYTKNGVRLGYGGGYYDRYLADDGDSPLCVGVGFQTQLTDVLPESQHDVRMDWILTDGGMIRCQAQV